MINKVPIISGLATLSLVLNVEASALESQAPTARIAVEDEPAGAAARVLDEAGTLPAFTVPLAVRVAIQGPPA